MFEGKQGERLRKSFITLIKISAKNFWNKDVEDAKFKIGELVKYKEMKLKIIGVNQIEDNLIEYALEAYHFMVWEDELEKI